jgi:colicin import membrane protein
MLSELTLSNWEDRQENLDQAEIERRLAEAQASEAEAEKNRAEEERAKAQAEEAKARARESASSRESAYKEVLEIQGKRLEELARLLKAESESRAKEWETAEETLKDMSEALATQSKLIDDLDQQVEKLQIAEAALLKALQNLKS